MFSVAYVILPFADIAPADAIRDSLARFQRGGPGDLPDAWITFHDETHVLRRAHEARFTFYDEGKNGGLTIRGDTDAVWCIAPEKLRDDMRRRGLREWRVRFADTMDLDTFFDRFCDRMKRHPVTGGYGHWLNPLGRWDWWDLGGRFDGLIIGERTGGAGLGAARISSGPSRGRAILTNIADQFGAALGQPPEPTVDVRADRNIELAETLLTDIRAHRDHARPGALVLPPGAVEERLRWLDTWPHLGPVEAFTWLGLPIDAKWLEVVEAAYERFQDHWVAGVAFHH